MKHELKIYPKYFEAVVSGKKKFEVRKNDRKFCAGDELILKEWDNIEYSGREVKAKVIYLMDDTFIGIQPGYVVMGIELENGRQQDD